MGYLVGKYNPKFWFGFRTVLIDVANRPKVRAIFWKNRRFWLLKDCTAQCRFRLDYKHRLRTLSPNAASIDESKIALVCERWCNMRHDHIEVPFFRANEQAPPGIPVWDAGQDRAAPGPRRETARGEAWAEWSVPMRQWFAFQEVLPQIGPILTGPTAATIFRDRWRDQCEGQRPLGAGPVLLDLGISHIVTPSVESCCSPSPTGLSYSWSGRLLPA